MLGYFYFRFIPLFSIQTDGASQVRADRERVLGGRADVPLQRGLRRGEGGLRQDGRRLRAGAQEARRGHGLALARPGQDGDHHGQDTP